MKNGQDILLGRPRRSPMNLLGAPEGSKMGFGMNLDLKNDPRESSGTLKNRGLPNEILHISQLQHFASKHEIERPKLLPGRLR